MGVVLDARGGIGSLGCGKTTKDAKTQDGGRDGGWLLDLVVGHRAPQLRSRGRWGGA